MPAAARRVFELRGVREGLVEDVGAGSRRGSLFGRQRRRDARAATIALPRREQADDGRSAPQH